MGRGESEGAGRPSATLTSRPTLMTGYLSRGLGARRKTLARVWRTATINEAEKTEYVLVGRTGFEPVTSSVSGKRGPIQESLAQSEWVERGASHLRERSERVAVSRGKPKHVGSLFRLPRPVAQREGAPVAIKMGRLFHQAIPR
jgi:hypothetical protein